MDAKYVTSTGPRANTESIRTILVATGANLGVALAKLGAALTTGSTALAAESAHAFADTGNEVLLLVAERRSRRPPDARHPFGYGRDAYFWSLLASIGVFLAAALFSIRVGVDALLDPPAEAAFLVGYIVLLVGVVFDGISLARGATQLRDEAHAFHRNPISQIGVTSDPTLRAVVVEDVTAILGDVIALVALALHQVTGSPAFEGVAAIVIGLIVAGTAAQLVRRNRDFLLGEPVSSPARARVERTLLNHAGVTAVRELEVTFAAPHRVWVLARIQIDDTLSGGEVEALVRSLEAELKAESPYIVRADIVPSG